MKLEKFNPTKENLTILAKMNHIPLSPEFINFQDLGFAYVALTSDGDKCLVDKATTTHIPLESSMNKVTEKDGIIIGESENMTSSPH